MGLSGHIGGNMDVTVENSITFIIEKGFNTHLDCKIIQDNLNSKSDVGVL